MVHPVTVLPENKIIHVHHGENLLHALQNAGLWLDAPCGGEGRCGKCTVFVEGEAVLSCRTTVTGPMCVTLPHSVAEAILTDGIAATACSLSGKGPVLAFDIGTTTVAGFLLDSATGTQLAAQAAPNPQRSFGADVISRIRLALDGRMEALCSCIRDCVSDMVEALCKQAAVDSAQIKTVSLAGNPAMQQLFFGISPQNLAAPPFAPVLKEGQLRPAVEYIPSLTQANILVVPDISGFVGADTVACVLATELQEHSFPALLVDIGTNGEMVLTDGIHMAACSTAAGPALEGALISCGMRAAPGAIDHVRFVNGHMEYSTIGGEAPKGMCGSGIIDAVAAALDAKLLNSRGKILDGDAIRFAEHVQLTQEDIRQVQLAKGAIAAGITLLAQHLHIQTADIRRVYLAGAFGSLLLPDSACRIGLLPPVLADRVEAVGNAAGSGAKILALDENALFRAQELTERIEHLDLASQKAFPRCFAQNMRFEV